MEPFATLTPADVRQCLGTPIAPVPATLAYRLRLTGVLLGLLLLQFSYAVLIGVVLGLTCLYGYFGLALFASPSAITLLLYAIPLAAGGIATVFLVKPLIVRQPKPEPALEIRPEDEPELFAFVERLCEVLGARRPSRIRANLQVNAFASLCGWRGFFFGDLDLTIGLPLAQGLTLPQFTGVLAHEFGHFTQGSGMRSAYLIAVIQQWFARVVHQRDHLDAWLDRLNLRRDWRIKTMALIATGAVAVSRKYLAFLMRMSSYVSSAFSRHMEFDADRHEASVVGAEVFRETSLRMPLLNVGLQCAWQDSQKTWSAGSLPDDVPALAAQYTDWMSDETRTSILDAEAARTTGRLDSHPSLTDRIASVNSAEFTGVFWLEGPASRLFQDLPRLNRATTSHHYQHSLGFSPEALNLISANETALNARSTRELEQACLQFLGGPDWFLACWFQIPAGEPHALEKQWSVDDLAPTYDVEGYDKAIEVNKMHFAAVGITENGVKVNLQNFRVGDSSPATARRCLANSSEELRLRDLEYRKASDLQARRIQATVAGLEACTVALVLPPDRELPIPDVRIAWPCYRALSRYQDELIELRRRSQAIGLVRQNAHLFGVAGCANLLAQLEREAAALMNRIVAETRDVPASMRADPRSGGTVSEQLTVTADSTEEQINLFIARMSRILQHSLGQLSWIALRAVPVPVESE